jgi:hypothetical protein
VGGRWGFPSLDTLIILLKYQHFSHLECLRFASLTPEAAIASAAFTDLPTGDKPRKDCCFKRPFLCFLKKNALAHYYMQQGRSSDREKSCKLEPI